MKARITFAKPSLTKQDETLILNNCHFELNEFNNSVLVHDLDEDNKHYYYPVPYSNEREYYNSTDIKNIEILS